MIGTRALLVFLVSLLCALAAVSPKRYEFPHASLTAEAQDSG